jgi:hypothetical protein
MAVCVCRQDSEMMTATGIKNNILALAIKQEGYAVRRLGSHFVTLIERRKQSSLITLELCRIHVWILVGGNDSLVCHRPEQPKYAVMAAPRYWYVIPKIQPQ